MMKLSALPDVPRWAVIAAHAVPLATLPSGLWRVALATGLPVAKDPFPGGWQTVYVLGLSVVAECLALLTLGLVRGWGEVVPGWVPLLGGRRVRTMAAVVPASLGAAGLLGLLGWSFYAHMAGLGSGATDTPVQEAILVACYLPLLAWAPLLIAVTVAYYRRRTGHTGAAWTPAPMTASK
ncbi:hypothetical protein OG453_06720 [Streptomyces sp. NBC_01381]|uniref:hypothetical protein n=1 Tax=Streptomyces sp. NBC_01381 TaxID=2903845 RepID=UPI00224D53FF|nr:hypothetical protein [Streptomyces sp. NBC_01381]MCX4666361.1 hypothetical protein [Streptomyces sp. NBC_01381]